MSSVCPLCVGVSSQGVSSVCGRVLSGHVFCVWACPLRACLLCVGVSSEGVSSVCGRVLSGRVFCVGACPRVFTLKSCSIAADVQS